MRDRQLQNTMDLAVYESILNKIVCLFFASSIVIFNVRYIRHVFCVSGSFFLHIILLLCVYTLCQTFDLFVSRNLILLSLLD